MISMLAYIEDFCKNKMKMSIMLLILLMSLSCNKICDKNILDILSFVLEKSI